MYCIYLLRFVLVSYLNEMDGWMGGYGYGYEEREKRERREREIYLMGLICIRIIEMPSPHEQFSL